VTRTARPLLAAYGSGQGLAILDCATALQYNALGRYDVALDAVRDCADARVAEVAPWVLPEDRSRRPHHQPGRRREGA
jgi:hypothetical protein